MIEHRAQLGEAFVCKNSDGSIEGVGTYCELPIVLKLTPDKQSDRYGYRVAIHMAPMTPQPIHD